MKYIVTGSEGLIGKNVCEYLSKENEVIKVDYQLGYGLLLDKCDLTDEKIVKEIFQKYKADCLVNLFAMNDHVDKTNNEKEDMFSISLDSFRMYMDVNLTALFSVCREYARNNDKGSIINFSSIYGLVSPNPKLYGQKQKHPGYCVSKAGVIQLTKYLAVYLAPRIRVNCIVPGGVQHQQSEDFKSAYSELTPIGRMMINGELCGAIEYFASDKASYTTGSILNVDGGYTIW